MENVKNELGNIYGSRISKNGNWLNLIIKVIIEGKETFITCPVKLADFEEANGKTHAGLEYARTSEGDYYIERANIWGIKVYQDKKPEEPKKEEKPVLDDECPF